MSSRTAGRGGGVSPPALVLTSVVSLQVGAAWAGRLFTVLPVAAVTGLRLWWAAGVMGVLGWRELRRGRWEHGRRALSDWLVVLVFGVTLGVMNFCIYQAFARIPLGIAVTIEFLGPLVVAIVASRRVVDVLWVVLAGLGVLLLSQGGGGGSHVPGRPAGGRGLDLVGVAFALVSAGCWAAYILLSRATGRRFSGSSGLVVAMVVAAVLVTPPAVISGGAGLLRPWVLAAGAGVGVLSSVIPYWLELETLRRVPARVFGIWMSLEPAVAALAGLVILGEVLAPREWLAIGCVVAACAGAARGAPEAALR